MNVGFDYGIYNNRITGTVDFYTRNSYDLIGLFSTSGVGGGAGEDNDAAGFKYGNYADMKSDGFEFSINTLNIKGKDFTWTTNFNVGYSKDVITRLDFNPRLGDALVQGGAAVLGGPRRGLIFNQICGPGLSGEFLPFMMILVRWYITMTCKIGRTSPTFYIMKALPSRRGAGGFGNIFTYKNFSLNVFLSFKFDYKIRLDDAFSFTLYRLQFIVKEFYQSMVGARR